MKKDANEYIPFGEEWVSEINKWPKSAIIERLRAALIDSQLSKDRYKDLADRYNDLLLNNCD